jgi:hypothetical protein
MKLEHDRQSLLTVLGISAGVATGVAAGLWLWRRRAGAMADALERWAEPRGSAQDVAEAFREDSKLSRRRIEVDSIAEGVVELSGSVRDRSEADRAVGIAQRTTGVYTVVNRLRVEDEESARETTRRRWNEGAPELRERQHYGMGVGMGTRRHSPATDPDRPSDKPRMLERDLDVGNVEDELDAALDPSPRPAATTGEGLEEGEVGGEPEGEAEDRG